MKKSEGSVDIWRKRILGRGNIKYEDFKVGVVCVVFLMNVIEL